jgi:hypothetical protein
MLVEIAQGLDDFVVRRNLEARAEGTLRIGRCTLRLLGQMALFEQHAPLTLAATKDVDLRGRYPTEVETELRRLLASKGLELDPVATEIWMPRETTYATLYAGELVVLEVADVDAVLISKALKAPVKNRPLIIEYLARGASPRFLALARTYSLDLRAFL